jgi:flagellin-like hook-associated protein FlgL
MRIDSDNSSTHRQDAPRSNNKRLRGRHSTQELAPKSTKPQKLFRRNRKNGDAAILTLSEKISIQIERKRTLKDIDNTASALNKMQDATKELDKLLKEQRELALKAEQWFYSDTERAYMQLDFKLLDEKIDNIMNLFAVTIGQKSDVVKTPNTSNILSVCEQQNFEEQNFIENENAAEKNDVEKSPALLKETSDLKSENKRQNMYFIAPRFEDVDGLIFDAYQFIKHGSNVESARNAKDAIVKIDKAIDAVSQTSVKIQEKIEDLQKEKSDLLSAVSDNYGIRFTKEQIIKRASNSMLSQANVPKQRALALIK